MRTLGLLFLLISTLLLSRGEARHGCVVEVSSPDLRLDLHQNVFNGQVVGAKLAGEASSDYLRLIEVDIEPLKSHKGEVSGRVKALLRVETDPEGVPIDSAHLPLPQVGQRYCFFLIDGREDGQPISRSLPMGERSHSGFSILPLAEHLPDDAPLLLERGAIEKAVAFFKEHRPDAQKVTPSASFLHRRWSVTFYQKTPPGLPKGMVFLSVFGEILPQTWIAKESPRKLPSSWNELPIGTPLVFFADHLANQELSAWPAPPWVIWGKVTHQEPEQLRGEFRVPGAPAYLDDRLPKKGIFGYARLAVVPEIPPITPAPLLPDL